MGMPDYLTLIRHGESEANVIQKADDDGTIDQFSPEVVRAIRERPDWEQRLTLRGVQQAITGGKWLEENGLSLPTFDAAYSSFYVRARETAYNIDPTYNFLRPHSTIHEQDWGAYGEATPDEQQEMFARTYRQHKHNPMFARLDGGESPLDTTTRLRDWRDTLSRKWDGKRVAAIMHGGTMMSMEAMIERWLPEDYAAVKSDKQRRVRNLTMMSFRRSNPDDPEDIRDHPNWRQIIYPDDVSNSPFGGEWVQLEDRRFLGSTALRASIEAIPRLLLDKD